MQARDSGMTAGKGAGFWLLQRVTALLLIPLSLWLLASLLAYADSEAEQLIQWLARPLPALAMGLLLVVLFLHLWLGLQVVVEDYVSKDGARRALVLLIRLLCLLLSAAGLIALVMILAAPG